MRSFSKKKYLCFRPVVDIDCMLKSEVAPHRSSSPSHFSRVPTSEKQQMVKNSKPKSVYFHHVSPKRPIFRVIKPAFYEAILYRRDHHKNRYIHDSFWYKHNNLKYGDRKTLLSPLSTSSSACFRSHASSDSTNVSNQYSTNEKGKEGGDGSPLEKQKRFEWYGIYLVIFRLAFTVLWGKLFGILLTSTVLHFFAVCDSSSPCKNRSPKTPRLRESPHDNDTRTIRKYHNEALNFDVRMGLFRGLCILLHSLMFHLYAKGRSCLSHNTKDSDMSALPVAKLGKNCRGGRDSITSYTFNSLCHAFIRDFDMTIPNSPTQSMTSS